MKKSKQIKLQFTAEQRRQLDAFVSALWGGKFDKRYLLISSRYMQMQHENDDNLKYLLNIWKNTDDEYVISLIDLKENKMLKLQNYPIDEDDALDETIEYLNGVVG